MMEQPLVALGDCVKVCWPADVAHVDGDADGSCASEHDSTRNDRKRKADYMTCQNIRDKSDIRKTRLAHLKYKIKKTVSFTKSSPESISRRRLPDHSLILAPMVGGSELAFRLLCRKYGATLAYTPMMNSERFVADEAYRKEQFQTISEDRPLVAHFSANNPDILLAAAKLVETSCDAIDLNLGCPQRVAHAGHFGSFLLDDEDRGLVLEIVRTVSRGITIPMFVKIRLLETVEKTILLCQQLIDAGASLIAIHARHRVSLVGRSGPSAREGPALLDQVKAIKEAVAHTGVPIIANGNVITWSDVEKNLRFTHADGIMSAEGILDDPALFFGSLKTGMEKPTPLQLAVEYLDLVAFYPVTLKCCIFHIRRMCKKVFESYQLLEACLSAQTVQEVRRIVLQAIEYETSGNYVPDKEKALKQKEALERKKREEGKRKQYEERMMRKAKREGKSLDHYLRVGIDPPTAEEVLQLKSMDKNDSFARWREKFGQHCYSHHLESGGCPRERTCAFLHMDATYLDDSKYG